MRRGCACDVDSADSYLCCSVCSLDGPSPTGYSACNILRDSRAFDVHDDARNVHDSADNPSSLDNRGYFRAYDGAYSIHDDGGMSGDDGIRLDDEAESTAQELSQLRWEMESLANLHRQDHQLSGSGTTDNAA